MTTPEIALSEVNEALARLDQQEKDLRRLRCNLNQEKARIEKLIEAQRPTCEG